MVRTEEGEDSLPRMRPCADKHHFTHLSFQPLPSPYKHRCACAGMRVHTHARQPPALFFHAQTPFQHQLQPTWEWHMKCTWVWRVPLLIQESAWKGRKLPTSKTQAPAWKQSYCHPALWNPGAQTSNAILLMRLEGKICPSLWKKNVPWFARCSFSNTICWWLLLRWNASCDSTHFSFSPVSSPHDTYK